jgi:hypothetical protein
VCGTPKQRNVGLKRTALGHFTQLAEKTHAADVRYVLTGHLVLGGKNAYSDPSAKNLPNLIAYLNKGK